MTNTPARAVAVDRGAGPGEGRLPVTLVGSLPRPKWLAGARVDRPDALFGQWRIPAEDLAEAQDDAVRAAVADQLTAGLDIITDGEQRREHFIWGFLQGLQGIDFDRVEPKRVRGDRYTFPAPTVTGEVRWTKPIHAHEVEFLRHLVSRWPDVQVKFTLPGPLTVVDSIHDSAYGQSRELAFAVAEALNAEARALAAAGCDVVQFDEPAFNIYLDDVEAWGIEALDRAARGVGATTAVHVCYGYGGSVAAEWKRGNRDWSQYHRLLPLLANSLVDQLSLEFTMPRLDPAVLRAAGDKTILFGAIDTGWDPPEPVDVVAARLRAALEHVPAARLQASTDCGFAPISRELARAKLEALSRAAALTR